MALRELLDRHFRLLGAGDADGLAGLYHEDAVLLRPAGGASGREAVRGALAALAQGRPRLVEVIAFAELEDTCVYHAVLALADGEERRVHGTIVVRGERILRHATGSFPAVSGPARGSTVQVDLEPYDEWVPHPVPDPRTAGREAIGPVLLGIVASEGPILAGRAYRLYVRASGGKALTSIARAPLSGSAHRLRNAGAIEMEGEGDEAVLRPAGSPRVNVRELGPRSLDEVPLEEVAELMRRLRDAGAQDLPRAVLDAYGLVRMTARAEEYVAAARARLE